MQLPAAQLAVHSAPSSHFMVQLPGPPQFIVHFDPALHVWVQPPTRQLKVQSAPFSQVCEQSVADVWQVAVQTLSSLHAILQPETVQFWVQSSFALHSQGSFETQPSVRDVRAGFGTSASPPPVPPSSVLEPDEEDEDEEVEPPSLEVQPERSAKPRPSPSVPRRSR